MRKKVGIVLMVLVAVGLAFLIGKPGMGGWRGPANGKLRVTASFYPMGEFARQVGGELVDVKVLVAPGVEPHDYDPSPQDMVAVHQSKVLVYGGAGLEPWADKVAPELERGGTVVVRASDGLKLLQNDAATKHDHVSGEAAGYDPHVWLDPVLAQREVDRIRDGLVRADPGNKAAYEAKAAAYKAKLADLDRAFRTGLAQCSRREIVTSHQAFAYLAREYGFTAIGLAGLSPEEEPSPQKLAEVAQFVREHEVNYIFFEELVSPKLAQTMAREVGAQTLVFSPLESLSAVAMKQGQDYLSVQRQNLDNLRIALDCK